MASPQEGFVYYLFLGLSIFILINVVSWALQAYALIFNKDSVLNVTSQSFKLNDSTRLSQWNYTVDDKTYICFSGINIGIWCES